MKPKISKKKFRSGFEKSIALTLTEAGVEYEFETVNVPYKLEHTYIPDFILPNGILIECKGYLSSDDRQKHLAVQEQHPGLDIRFVFMAPNGVVGGAKKLTCAKWAERHGFKWAKRWIPKDWMRESSRDISHVKVVDQVTV